MNSNEAVDYVDIIVEQLVKWQIITQEAYEHMTENQRQYLGDLVLQHSEE